MREGRRRNDDALPDLLFRDGVGLFGDYYLNLKTHFWENTDYWIATGIDALVIVANDKDTYEGIKKDALDPYLFIRDAYR